MFAAGQMGSITKHIAAFSLLVLFLLQNFASGFMYIDYLLDKQAYAQFCENKKKPMLHCDGQCQLSKKIAREEQKNAPMAPAAVSKNDWSPYQVVSLHFLFTQELTIIKHCMGLFPSTSIHWGNSLFHPPNVA